MHKQSLHDFVGLFCSLFMQGEAQKIFPVHEHFKMVYRLDEMKDVVYIIHFWDVRREPQRLAEEIEKL